MSSESDSEAALSERGAAAIVSADRRFLDRFLELQHEDLRLRSEELTARRKDREHGHEFSLKALEVQAGDLKDSREKTAALRRSRHWLIGFCVTIGALLVGYLASQGSAELVEELIKAILFLATGSTGGYAFGRLRVANDS